MQYTKRPLSIDEQAQKLIDRGLICTDVTRLKHYLTTIGYYRLSAYWLPFEQPSANGSRNHNFQPNTDFESVLKLYVFDRKIRVLIIDAIERIEVAVRTRWAGEMALRYGSHAYMQAARFKNAATHANDLIKIEIELNKSHETFVAHYKNNYSTPHLPPIWAVVEVMSFGALSHWIKNTADTDVKKEIMRAVGLPKIEILEEVLHILTPIRNTCAHHGRLWNRRFPMKMPEIKRLSDRMIPHGRPADSDYVKHLPHYIYNYLMVMEFLVSKINPCGTWKNRLFDLLGTVGPDEHRSMGFPADWKTRKPWA